jgi:hypothetical protein
MAIALADDLDVIFTVEDFATVATYSGASINGIFDNETVPMDAGGTAQVHQEQPRFTCRTIDVSGLASGDTITINAITYNIVAWIHDGTGVTVLQLEKP